MTEALRPAPEIPATEELRAAGRGAGRMAGRVPAAMVSYDVLALAAAMTLAGVPTTIATAFVVVTVAVLAMTGSYRQRISPTVGEEVPALAARPALIALLLGVLVAPESATYELLRGTAAAVILLVVGRAVAYAMIRSARRNGVLREPTLIVGAGHQGVLMAKTLTEHPEYGLVPVGFIDGFDDELEPPILGNVDRLDEVLEGEWIRRVIIAFGSNRESELVSILRAAERHNVEVHVLPRFFELGVVGSAADIIWGIPLVRVRRAAVRTTARRIKRTVDVAVSAALLAMTAPLMILVALAVKISSPGPVLFRQCRVGQRGKEVEILKFRSMPVNDDSDHTWSVDNDQRLGRVGRLLRRTSVDELPQLFNVLRGDMSIVGPRPERRVYVDAFGEQVRHYGDRHRVPVGLTGWAQIHRLRGDTSIEERARFDNFYIENWSLWRDILVMLRTLPAMLQRPGDAPDAEDPEQ